MIHRIALKKKLKMFVMLAVVWFILSGVTEPMILTCGLVAILATTYIAGRIGIDIEFKWNRAIFHYILRLLQEIALSSIDIVKIILNKENDAQAGFLVVKFDKTLSPAQALMHGSAITMTPGTVVIAMENDAALLHVVDKNSFVGINPNIRTIVDRY